jgi:hypothetical protein
MKGIFGFDPTGRRSPYSVADVRDLMSDLPIIAYPRSEKGLCFSSVPQEELLYVVRDDGASAAPHWAFDVYPVPTKNIISVKYALSCTRSEELQITGASHENVEMYHKDCHFRLFYESTESLLERWVRRKVLKVQPSSGTDKPVYTITQRSGQKKYLAS